MKTTVSTPPSPTRHPSRSRFTALRFAAVILTAVVFTASAAMAQTPQDLVGSEFQISGSLLDETAVDVAYDSVNDRFMIVWEVATPFPDIWAAIYNSDGTAFSQPDFLVSANTFSARPKVAFNSGFGYLVVWEDDTALGGRDILGIQVHPITRAIGGVIDLSQQNPAIQANPDVVALDSSTNDFFVVWQDQREGDWDIYGQPIVNGAPFGNNVEITQDTQSPLPDTTPAIAPGLGGHHFIVWERDVGANVNIFGGLMTREGVARIGPLLLGFGPAQQVAPAIAFAPLAGSAGRYLAVWESDIAPQAYNIEGALIDVNFSNFGFAAVPDVIFASLVPTLEPDVAYDDANQQFLVAWEQVKPFSFPQDWDVVGGYIGVDGAFGRLEDIAVANTTSQLLPSIAFGTSRDEFFAAWHDNRNVHIDIWGQRLEYVAPFLTLTSPNGGESWPLGSQHTITWDSNIGNLTTVTLELLRGGSAVLTITNSTENDGSFDWTIPTGLTPATDYSVRIASVLNILTDTSDADFSITGGGTGGLAIASPNGGETWQAGTQRVITWTGDTCLTVNLDLYKGGAFDSTIVASTDNDGSYSWTIPGGQTPGSDYRVRVTCTTDAANLDESDANFTITDQPVPTITVTQPNGGEAWQQGSVRSIRWTSGGSVGTDVKIELLKGGSLNSTIVATTPNDGEFSWAVPAGQAVGSDYRVRITDASNATVLDESDGNFSITASGGLVLKVTSPNGGETWTRGERRDITWDPGNAGVTVRIDLVKGAATYQNIVPSTSNFSGLYNWSIPQTLPIGGDYRILITSNTNPQVSDRSDAPFMITGTTQLQVTSPNGGETWQAGTQRTITWVPDVSPTVQIQLLKGGAVWSTIATSTSNDGSFAWAISSGQRTGSDFRVRVFSLTVPSEDDTSDANFAIVAPQKPDLGIEAFDFSPQDVDGGDPIQFSGHVVNNGPGTARDDFWVEFKVSPNYDFSDPKSFLVDSERMTADLAPGQFIDLSTLLKVVNTPAKGLAEGAYVVGITIDPLNEVDETDEANNSVWTTPKKIYIGPRPSPAKRWSLYR